MSYGTTVAIILLSLWQLLFRASSFKTLGRAKLYFVDEAYIHKICCKVCRQGRRQITFLKFSELKGEYIGIAEIAQETRSGVS